MIEGLRRVIKRVHYPLEVMLTCVRWYAAYPLSLRHIEEMMQKRGVFVEFRTRRDLRYRCASPARLQRAAQVPFLTRT